MIRFYAPEIESNPILPESDSQHCVRVLRMTPGDTVHVVDGKGHSYECVLVDAHPKHAMVEIVNTFDEPLSWTQQITLAVAPSKHMDRMEWMVEKLVEIGINRILPIKCRYSERKEIKRERLEKIAVSAMKQSLKSVMPVIDEMIPYDRALEMINAESRYIAYCNDTIVRRDLSEMYRPNISSAILIGPEGDFSEAEIAKAFDAGYIPVTLGNNRLRTETAAVYSVSAFHILDSYANTHQ